MPIDKIERLLFAFENKLSGKISCFWLAFATIFSLIYSSTALQEAFSSQYVVQDDARQHVFWMRRFLDAELFPHDSIADYFQSVAPWGYKIVYAVPASLNIDPFVVSKMLPIILGLITTYYSFVFTLELLPIPFTGFITTLVLNQNIWSQGSLVSATPKAFAIPLLLAFLYYSKRSLVGTGVSILLCGLFYPSLVFICSGLLIVGLWQFKNNSLCFKKQSRDIVFCILGLSISFLVLLPLIVSTSEYAPTITVEQARSLPDFAADGRSYFFNDKSSWDFWFNGSRSGLRISSAFVSTLAYLAILLPVLFRFSQVFPLTQKVSPKIEELAWLILVSIVMFFIAHLLLFQLHLPSRYTQNSWKTVVAISSGIASTIIVRALWQKITNCTTSRLLGRIIKIFFLACLAGLLITFSYFSKNSIRTKYTQGNEIELYQFLRQQPKNTIIASLTVEADNLPTFAQRSILVSREYAIPYHTGYYFPYRQKVINLIGAIYSDNLGMIKKFVRQYKVNFFLLERGTFTPGYIVDNSWIKQHQPIADDAVTSLQQGTTPALKTYQNSCSVLRTRQYNLVSAQCLLN